MNDTTLLCNDEDNSMSTYVFRNLRNLRILFRGLSNTFNSLRLTIRRRRNMMRINCTNSSLHLGNLFMRLHLLRTGLYLSLQIRRLARRISLPTYNSKRKMSLYDLSLIPTTSNSLQERNGRQDVNGTNERRYNLYLFRIRNNATRIAIINRYLLSGYLRLQIYRRFSPERVARINHVYNWYVIRKHHITVRSNDYRIFKSIM